MHNLFKILKFVFLNSTINDCALTINNKVGSIMAIDPTNSVFVSANVNKIELDINKTLGLTGINNYLKFFSTVKKEIKYEVKNDKIIFTANGGKISFTIVAPESIQTYVKKENTVEALQLKSKEYLTFQITDKDINKFEYFSKLFTCDKILLSTSKNKLKISGHGQEGSYFNFSLTEKINNLKEDISLNIEFQYLSAIFDLMKFEKKCKKEIKIKKDSPIVLIIAGKNLNVIWAISQMED